MHQLLLTEKDIPSHYLDEQRYAKQASSSGGTALSRTTNKIKNDPAAGQSIGSVRGDLTQGPDFEAKVGRLIELGFEREAVVQALKLLDGNEDQAADFLFGD